MSRYRAAAWPLGHRPSRCGSALKVVALLGAAGAMYGGRERIVDRLVDVTARRPSGMLGRLLYHNPRAHFASFDATLAALALVPADRLLEVACGGGTFLERALTSGCEVKAIDYSPDMVALTCERNAVACRDGRLEVLQASAEQLPFTEESFTCAAMTNAFFFLDDPARALAELYRVLEPHGRLAIFTAAPDPPAWMAPPPIAHRMRFFTDQDLHTMARTAGFIDVKIAREDDGLSQLLIAVRS
jgi:SAM-dependent methyltransferase